MKIKQSSIIDLLQLSKKEQVIFNLLNNESSTPVSLAKKCSIPRPTIYITLEKLHNRGLIIKKKISHKTYWQKNSDDEIESLAYRFKELLSASSATKQEKISITDSSQVVVHRGQKAIFKLFSSLVDEHAGEKMIALQGNLAGYAWSKLFNVQEINIINQKIKKNKVITELVTSREWFKSQTELFGTGWAKNFEGRTIRMQDVGNQYLNYASQIFIFRDKVYIDAMSDKVFIEIKNPEIAKLLVSITQFVQDHSEVLDANKLLRELISNNSK